MPITPADKRNAVNLAAKMTEAAVTNAGQHALLYPDQVTRLLEQLSTKIQELWEKAESGR